MWMNEGNAEGKGDEMDGKINRQKTVEKSTGEKCDKSDKENGSLRWRPSNINTSRKRERGRRGAIEKSAGRAGVREWGRRPMREQKWNEERESSQYVLQFIWSFIRGSETERGRQGAEQKQSRDFQEKRCVAKINKYSISPSLCPALSTQQTHYQCPGRATQRHAHTLTHSVGFTIFFHVKAGKYGPRSKQEKYQRLTWEMFCESHFYKDTVLMFPAVTMNQMLKTGSTCRFSFTKHCSGI